MERIDIGLATKIINEAGENRVPVGPSIQPNSVIHGAMDNFDHDENTASGIGGSHEIRFSCCFRTSKMLQMFRLIVL